MTCEKEVKRATKQKKVKPEDALNRKIWRKAAEGQ
jgi:ribosomal protein L31E